MSPSQITLLLLALMASATALPQSRARSSGGGGKEALFRCTDERGQIHYGDRQPLECFGRDTEVLNDRGTLLRVIEGDQSRAARQQRETQENIVRRQREEAAQHDRMLIETYLSVEDIERLRNQRLELLDAQVIVSEQNIASMKLRQSRLEQQIARFRPYSSDPNAQALPDHLAEDMINTVNSLRTYERTIASRKAEQDALKAAFTRDIARFKQLKGIR